MDISKFTRYNGGMKFTYRFQNCDYKALKFGNGYIAHILLGRWSLMLVKGPLESLDVWTASSLPYYYMSQFVWNHIHGAQSIPNTNRQYALQIPNKLVHRLRVKYWERVTICIKRQQSFAANLNDVIILYYIQIDTPSIKRWWSDVSSPKRVGLIGLQRSI